MKNTIAAAVMMSAITFGTTFAHAGTGIIISKGGERQQCSTATTAKPSFMNRVMGTIVEGIILAKVGIIISKEGIIISQESSSKCDSPRSGEGVGIIIS